jgi:hypothetical protein
MTKRFPKRRDSVQLFGLETLGVFGVFGDLVPCLTKREPIPSELAWASVPRNRLG